MDKKGDMPFWLVMMLFALMTLIAIIIIIGTGGHKMQGFLDWLAGVF